MALDGFIDASPILRSGVYALVRKGVVVYVGKAKNLYSRVYTHKHFANRAAKGQRIPDWLPTKGIQFDEVHIRPCHVDGLAALEYEMINLYKPKFNQSLKNNLKVSAPITIEINGVMLQMNEPPRPQISRRL